jgi:hypothetical protein
VHGSSTYLWYGSTLVVPAALVSLALALRERRPVFSLAAAAVWAIALFRIVPVGNRIFLLPLLGGAFVYLYVRRGSRPGRTMLVALLASGLLASYAVLLYRYPDSRTGPGTIVTSVFRHPSRPFRSILRGPDAEMAPALAGALTVVPSKLGYRYGGAVLGDLVLRPVPRQLWPGKPETPSQKIVSVAFPSAAPYLNPAFSPLIFLFWDFWIVGVLVGMALFGLLARALYEWFLRFRHDLAAQLVFAVGLWFVVIGARNDPVDTIVISASVLFPLAAVSWLGDRRFRAVPRLASRPLDVSER